MSVRFTLERDVDGLNLGRNDDVCFVRSGEQFVSTYSQCPRLPSVDVV